MKKYTALLLSALIAVPLCCSCSEKSTGSSSEAETAAAETTESETTALQTTAEAVTTVAVTTDKQTEMSFTKEDLRALDLTEICNGRISGVCCVKDFDEDSGSYTDERYEFAIDNNIQTGWVWGQVMDADGQTVKNVFDYEISVYSINGTESYERYDSETKTRVRSETPERSYEFRDHYTAYVGGVAPVHLSAENFRYCIESNYTISDDDFDIIGEKTEDGRRIACISRTYDSGSEGGTRYDSEIDLDTGMCVASGLYDHSGRLLRYVSYEDIKYGDEALPPKTQQEVKELIESGGYTQGMFCHDLSVLDGEIKLMPEVFDGFISCENALWNN